MNIELTKVSLKGQVVIPQKIRASLEILPGTRFVVFEKGGNVVLKKLEIASPDILA
ncbi:AbrB/MazE/SpoVT family DNA-binding domain-containing protein [Candidatus Altiarchaeota archaeon]